MLPEFRREPKSFPDLLNYFALVDEGGQNLGEVGSEMNVQPTLQIPTLGEARKEPHCRSRSRLSISRGSVCAALDAVCPEVGDAGAHPYASPIDRPVTILPPHRSSRPPVGNTCPQSSHPGLLCPVHRAARLQYSGEFPLLGPLRRPRVHRCAPPDLIRADPIVATAT